jgi:hypothetical protein
MPGTTHLLRGLKEMAQSYSEKPSFWLWLCFAHFGISPFIYLLNVYHPSGNSINTLKYLGWRNEHLKEMNTRSILSFYAVCVVCVWCVCGV